MFDAAHPQPRIIVCWDDGLAKRLPAVTGLHVTNDEIPDAAKRPDGKPTFVREVIGQ